MHGDLERSRQLYQTLNLPDFSSIEEVRQAYKILVLKYHPDKNLHDPSAAERFRSVSIAYETLSNGEKKAKYDATLRTVHPLGAYPPRGGSCTPRSKVGRDGVPTHCATSSIYEELNTYALRKAGRPGRRAPSASTPRGTRPSLYTKEQQLYFKKREKEHQAELRKRWEQEKREQWEREKEVLRKQQLKREETQHIFQLHRAVNSGRRVRSSRVQRGTSAHGPAEEGRSVARSLNGNNARGSTGCFVFTPSPRARCPSSEALCRRFGLKGRSVTTSGTGVETPQRVGRESNRRLRPTGLRPRGTALIEGEESARALVVIAAEKSLMLLHLQTKEAWCRAVYAEECRLAFEALHLLEEERRSPIFTSDMGFFTDACFRGRRALCTEEAVGFSEILILEREDAQRRSIVKEFEGTLLSYRCLLSLFQRQVVMNKLLKGQRAITVKEEELFRNMLRVSLQELVTRHRLQQEEEKKVTHLIKQRAQERHAAYLKHGEQMRLEERRANAVITASLQKEVERLQYLLKSSAVKTPSCEQGESHLIPNASTRAASGMNGVKPATPKIAPANGAMQTSKGISGRFHDPQRSFHRRPSSTGSENVFDDKAVTRRCPQRGTSPGWTVRPERTAPLPQTQFKRKLRS